MRVIWIFAHFPDQFSGATYVKMELFERIFQHCDKAFTLDFNCCCMKASTERIFNGK